MWALQPPAAAAGLAALSVAFFPQASAKPYPAHIEELQELHNASRIELRQECSGTWCGWSGQLCCPAGTSCYTDSNNQAQCGEANSGGVTGGWVYYTTTYVETDYQTHVSVFSSLVGGAPATPTAGCSGSQNVCGGTCCDSGYYCYDPQNNQCRMIAGGSSGGIGTLTPSAPLRPTSSTLIIVTATGTPTATVPFETPIATGANGSLVESDQGGSGLSGGAIAGIVIGVILGVILLLLLCLFCCAKSLFDTLLACLGFGRKRRHTHEESYVESHHHSSGVGGGGRRWYGQGPSRPPRSEKKSGVGGAAGVAGVLGGLALALGLKRAHDRRHDDKSTTISGSSAYYSDYTTSASECTTSWT